MRARLYTNQLKIGAAARDYIRLVTDVPHRPTKNLSESRRGEAQGILESIRDQESPEDDLDISITGHSVVQQLDRDLEDFSLIPYWYSDLARSRGEGIYPGVQVIIDGDSSLQSYRTIEVSFDQESVRMKDSKGREFILPWDLVVPVQGQEKERPYWFTGLARERGDDLQVGDYVRVLGLEQKYELTDIFWQYGDVQVRKVGATSYLGMPWKHIRPWEE
jgi:hypothetical protein